MKIAFYKKSKTFFGGLIRFKQYWLSGLPWRHAQYSHVELVFNDGLFFSSSECDDGTRFKMIKPKDEHWDIMEIDCDEDVVRDFCERQSGNKYAWGGIILAQGLNFNYHKKGNWYCSHICTRALQADKKLCSIDALFTSPGKLHKLLAR